MKKAILLLLLFNIIFCTAQSTIYYTSNSSNIHHGKWAKVASVTLSTQYSNSNSTILLSGGNSSSNTTSSKLFFRVKQQGALPSPPYIQLELIQANNSRLKKNDVKAVTTTLDASKCIVDLYLRVTNTYEVIAMTPVFINNISPTFYSNQGFMDSLPLGDQTSCNYPSNYFGFGYFESSVGIGTETTGSHKLTVEGSIGAREIKVEASSWSDFVFFKDYQLPTLEEVENHIKEEGHLKDIPSAKEVAENGIFLGEMDSKLLQKIEELTLYTIEQEKKIKNQADKIENLELLNKKFIELQSRLEKLESN